jgi:hypothetical protein
VFVFIGIPYTLIAPSVFLLPVPPRLPSAQVLYNIWAFGRLPAIAARGQGLRCNYNMMPRASGFCIRHRMLGAVAAALTLYVLEFGMSRQSIASCKRLEFTHAALLAPRQPIPATDHRHCAPSSIRSHVPAHDVKPRCGGPRPRPPCFEVCPADPGSPRRNIEGESPLQGKDIRSEGHRRRMLVASSSLLTQSRDPTSNLSWITHQRCSTGLADLWQICYVPCPY